MTAGRFVRVASVVLLVGAPVLLGGCVGAFFRQPVNVETTRTDVEALRKEQAELLSLVRELRARLDAQSETVAGLRADMNVEMGDLESRLQVLQSQLEEQGVRFERLQRRPEPVPVATPPAVADTAAAGAGGGESAVEPGSPAAPAQEIYDAAFRDFNRGSYPIALAGFQEFLRAYPDHPLADNAQYWIGDCYYGMERFDDAIREYLKVRDLYPDGDKVPAATLKAGYAFLRKGDTATARRYFETTMREFPNSPEADLARDKLAGLN